MAAAAFWIRRFSRSCVILVRFLCRLTLSDNIDDGGDNDDDNKGLATSDNDFECCDVFVSYSFGCRVWSDCSLVVATVSAAVVDWVQVAETVSRLRLVLVVMAFEKMESTLCA